MTPFGAPSPTELISGEGTWVGPMMKLPSASTGGTWPSGNSVAWTYPAASGSRVGAGGPLRARAAAGGPADWAEAMLVPINNSAAVRKNDGFMGIPGLCGQGGAAV